MIWQPVSRSNGEEIPEYPGNFYFSDARLMLSTYVDDLTFAGPKGISRTILESFVWHGWRWTTSPPIHRILGNKNTLDIQVQKQGMVHLPMCAIKNSPSMWVSIPFPVSLKRGFSSPCRTSSPFSRLTPTSPAQAWLGSAWDRFFADFPDAPCMDCLSTWKVKNGHIQWDM